MLAELISLPGTEASLMSDETTRAESKKLEQPIGAQGVVFAVVGAASGVFAAIKLTSAMPIWAAILLTFLLWLLLVVCTTASCDSELLDILVGSVTIIIVMAV